MKGSARDWRMSFSLQRYGALKDRLGLSDFAEGGAMPGDRGQLAHRLMVRYRDEITRGLVAR